MSSSGTLKNKKLETKSLKKKRSHKEVDGEEATAIEVVGGVVEKALAMVHTIIKECILKVKTQVALTERSGVKRELLFLVILKIP